jgi:hypothetical protein
MSSRGEGAIIDRRARTVRLRHEPVGFVYELRGDGDTFEVVRIDRASGHEEPYGALRLNRDRWRAAKADAPHKADALAMIARAWNYARFLKPKEMREKEADDESAGGSDQRK